MKSIKADLSPKAISLIKIAVQSVSLASNREHRATVRSLEKANAGLKKNLKAEQEWYAASVERICLLEKEIKKLRAENERLLIELKSYVNP